MGVAISKSSKQPAAQPQPDEPKKSKWYSTGNSNADEVAKEDARQEAKRAEQGKLWRFFLEQGEKAEVTFVDGNLTNKGVLDCFMFREHHLFMNGKWGNFFVCVSGEEPCPIDESGDASSLVCAFTIIDHREYTSKKGEKYKDTKRLFVCKSGTYKLLQAEAVKRGGLVGVRMDISRLGGDNSPRVGDAFSFTSKEDPKVLAKKYTRKVKGKDGKETIESLFVPADYSEEITYRPAKVLREMGFGKGNHIGGEGPVNDAKPASKSVADEM